MKFPGRGKTELFLIKGSISKNLTNSFMDHQLQLVAKFSNYLPFLRRFSLPVPAAAAVCSHDSQSSVFCAICLNDIRGGDSYRELPECGHFFHADCIDPWLKSHATCPLCRTQLSQLILMNESEFQFGDLVSNFVMIFQSFVEKMCNPLNDELASMLCSASLR